MLIIIAHLSDFIIRTYIKVFVERNLELFEHQTLNNENARNYFGGFYLQKTYITTYILLLITNRCINIQLIALDIQSNQLIQTIQAIQKIMSIYS